MRLLTSKMEPGCVRAPAISFANSFSLALTFGAVVFFGVFLLQTHGESEKMEEKSHTEKLEMLSR